MQVCGKGKCHRVGNTLGQVRACWVRDSRALKIQEVDVPPPPDPPIRPSSRPLLPGPCPPLWLPFGSLHHLGAALGLNNRGDRGNLVPVSPRARKAKGSKES